ncbi:MAG: PCRF domain-containing protein [Patescibacteria group bacterium]
MEKVDEQKSRIAELEAVMQAPEFWQDKTRAQEVVREHARLKVEASGVGGYDDGPAIITIFSGAGGDDAEDFSRLLAEMYFKFATRRGWETKLVHEHTNDHGGYRNLTFEVRGRGAYGILKNESGVHRLVRISPFNAKKLRHTSFSLVEVVPVLPAFAATEIPESELRIEFSRAGGPGGQNVNKRETAVRVVHVPTGLSAHAETERSQERNRAKALEILRGKIYKLRQDEQLEREKGLRVSKSTDIEWGSQIRSYVLHPYKLVKDHRTGVETTQIEDVLAGELDKFVS